MIHAYWVTFKARRSACIEAKDIEDARTLADGYGAVESIDILPYPANPRIGVIGNTCPSFCYRPEKCKGRTSCPQRPACTE